MQYKHYFDFLSLYDAWEYSEILRNQTSWSPEMLHNYGITAFELFKESGFSDISPLQQANLLFSWSLQKQENEKTRYQYDFTTALLDLFKTEQPQDQDQQTQENQQEWNQWESWENEQGEEWSEQDNSWSQSQNWRDSQYFLQQEEDIPPLSPVEQQQVQESIEQLKLDQMKNQQFYGKQEQLTPFQEAFDSVFWTVDRGWEKDW